MDTQFANFFVLMGRLTDIKEEALDQSFSLISPPATPSPPSLPSVSSTTSRRRGSASSLAVPKRPRPYPLINRDISSRKEELGTMSTNAAYGSQWNNSGGRSVHSRHPPVERKSEGESQSTYNFPTQYMNEQFLTNMQDRQELGTIPSSSSLTGAMGDASISSHPRHSRSPTLSNSGDVYTANMPNHGLPWNTAPPTNMPIAMTNSLYPGVPGHGGLPFTGMNQSEHEILNDYPTTRNVSPASLSPHSPNYPKGYTSAYGTANRGPFPPQHSGDAMGFHGSSTTNMYSSEDKNSQVAHLQRRIRELEQECSRAKIAQGGLPGAPQSPAFQASWSARTETRKKLFCSLNRAGNALCAWHDSRRERRVYPPRNAPAGYLNCGCSYEEALFEESLARHGVGSYHPGETVRMDPALRNPLLKLLQTRYGYKDGDFEHDPITESWYDGESPTAWDQKLQSGQMIKRRADSDRH